MKNLIFIFLAILVVAGILQRTDVLEEELIHAEQVFVEFPITHQLVQSPLVVSGKAKGTWFFEADFPVMLIDGNGKELVSGYAITGDEWMTTDFVSFESIPLIFRDPETPNGFLILFKHNPSDIEELNDQIIVPVTF